MSEHKAKYGVEISGVDKVIHSFHKMEEGAEKFEKRLEGTHEKALELFAALGLGFEAFEFLKEAVDEYRELNIAQARLNLLLKNSGAGKEMFGELKTQAKEFSESLGVTELSVVKLQAQMANIFPNANGSAFKLVTEDVENFATATGKSAEEAMSVIMKGLLRPDKIRLLANELGLSKPEADKISKLGATGHVRQADKLILEILDKKYKNGAEEIRKADPMFELNKSILELKEALGPPLGLLVHELTPRIKNLVDGIDNWLKKLNPGDIENYISDIKKGIEGLVTIWGITKAAGAVSTIGKGVGAIAGEAAGVSAAVTLVEIAAIAAGVYLLFGNTIKDAFKGRPEDSASIKLDKNIILGDLKEGASSYNKFWGKNDLTKLLKNHPETLDDKDFINNVLTKASKNTDRTFGTNIANIINNARNVVSDFEKYKTNVGLNKISTNETKMISPLNSSYKTIKDKNKEEADLNKKSGKGPGNDFDVPDSVVGSKSTSIFITINDGLVHELNFHTTNLTESAGIIEEEVAAAIANALNTAQGIVK